MLWNSLSLCPKWTFIALLFISPLASPLFAQGWGLVEGTVKDAATQEPLVGVSIGVLNTNYGRATDATGRFRLRIPAGKFVLKSSYVGYKARLDTILVLQDRTTLLNMALVPMVTEIEEVGVVGDNRDSGVQELTAEQIRSMPSPMNDGFRRLAVLPGVVSVNEMSNEYSVRGGGYNENLVFINGFEVYKPFRTRQGEQEGLGLFNPDLTSKATLYTGGFPARYGGKLSSALEIAYLKPDNQEFQGSASFSTLDASASVSGSSLKNKLGWVAGFRKAQPSSFFGSQEIKGNYQPNFTDVQSLITFRPSKKWSAELLGIWAKHSFTLEPTDRRTYFGSFTDLRSVFFSYSGTETDGYDIKFGGIRNHLQINPTLKTELALSYFNIDEKERYDISGAANLFSVDPSGQNPDVPTGQVTQIETAKNRVQIKTLSAENRWIKFLGKSVLEGGLFFKQQAWADSLSETASVRGQVASGEIKTTVLENLQGYLPTTTTYNAGAYLQQSFNLSDTADRTLLTAGLRAEYFEFNNEWTFSPRLNFRYRATPLLAFNAAAGVYYQQPSYRELRGEPQAGQSIEASLNRTLKSQRAIQFISGAEYTLPKTRMYVRGEAYYKKLDNLISYDIRNTRLTYAGETDSDGYAYGFDLQFRGEFVPGLESWVNYGFLKTKEKFRTPFVNEYNDGWRARPTDQRHNISLFIQDNVPNDPSWRFYTQIFFASGLPYTPPVPGETVDEILTQEQGERNSRRYLEYKRADLGVSKLVTVSKKALHGNIVPQLQLSLEVLNMFDNVNTIAYSWITNIEGRWERIPTRLSPRMFNARMRLSF